MPKFTRYPGESDEAFIARIRAGNDSPTPMSTQATSGGGSFSLPSVLPAQASGFGSGEIGQSMTNAQPGAPAPKKGPTIYEPAPSSVPTPAANQSLASGGSPLSGPSSFAPRSITTPLNTSVTSTLGGGGAGGVDIGSILAALGAGFQAPRDELNKFGKSYRKQIGQNFKQDVARQEQDAASRGLGNSTIRESLLGGARSRQQDASLALEDRLAAARAGLFERQSPNIMQAAQLATGAVSANQGTDIRSILKALGFAR